MQTYTIDDVEEETLSLSNFYKQEDGTISSQRSLSSSSSSSLSDDQDFLGFFSDEWDGNTSYGATLPANIVFCGKVISSGEPMARDQNAVTYKTQSWPLFRSNSDSFRFMRLKTSLRRNTTRSNSLPNKSASFPYKSKLMVFMFGSRSSKFLNKVEMSDIKNRQLRRQSSMTVSAWVESGKEENGGQNSGSKGWWRVVDVLGCGGGYEKDTTKLGVI